MNEPTTTIIGNLTGDPEIRYTPNGAAVASVNIASTPRSYDKSTGQWKDGETLFMRATVWHQYAENVAESLHKGDRVIATGRLTHSVWTSKEGVKQSRIEMQADEIGPALRFARATPQRVDPQQRTTAPLVDRTGQQETDPWATQAAPTWGQSEAPF